MGRFKATRIVALAAAVVFVFCVAGGCSGKAKKKPLSEVPINVDSFAEKSPASYALGLNADPKTWDWKSKANFLYQKSTQVLPDRVEIVDVVTAGPKTYTMRLTCRKNVFLEVMSSHVTEEEGGKILDESRVEVKAGQLRQNFSHAAPSVMDYPDNTISQAGLMRIVTRLPREKGIIYTFPSYFDPQEPRPETGPDMGLECKGETTVTVADRKVACTLYVLTGTRRECKFYVDAEGVLQFMEMDGGYTRMAYLTPDEFAKFPKSLAAPPMRLMGASVTEPLQPKQVSPAPAYQPAAATPAEGKAK